MHPRVTIHDHVFPRDQPLDAVLAGFARGGAERVGLGVAKLAAVGGEAAGAAVAAAGLEVTHLVHGRLLALEDPASWPAAQARAAQTLELASAVGARCVYGVTGPAMSLTWEDAAEAFVEGAGPVTAQARSRGIPFLIEPTNMLFADVSFIHTLRDTVDLAGRAGFGVCLDVQHCWTERGLRETIRRAAPALGLVQLSDYVPGTRKPFRAVPGDGVVPLERIVADVLEAGYTGLFDLELYEEPGVDPAETIARAGERAGTMLERLGA
jgi:sugar phosphate isomerase/epimerase